MGCAVKGHTPPYPTLLREPPATNPESMKIFTSPKSCTEVKQGLRKTVRFGCLLALINALTDLVGVTRGYHKDPEH